MPIDLQKGTDAVVQRQYRVKVTNDKIAGFEIHDGEVDNSLIVSYNEDVEFMETAIAIDNFNDNVIYYGFTDIGEIDSTGISIVSEDGTVIEGNNSGEVILDKNCSMELKLINCTQANIDAIQGLINGQRCYIYLEEISSRDGTYTNEANGATYQCLGIRQIIILGGATGIVVNSSELIKGKDVMSITLKGKETVPKISSFRYIGDRPFGGEA